MPDGMTPEQPNRDLNLRIPGQTDINREGNIAQNRQFLDISQPNFSPDDPDKELAEREAFERNSISGGSEYDKGRVIEAIITRHPKVETVRYALRTLQLSEERFNTNGEPDNRWEVSHRYRVLADRQNVLEMPLEDLVKKDLIERLSPSELEFLRQERGRSLPANINENYLARPKHVDGFGFENYVVSQPVLESFAIKEGKRTDERYRMMPQQYVYLRSETERRETSKEFGSLKDEVSARTLMMQMWGHHVSYYYALQKLAEGHYFGTTLSSEGVGIMFNLKGQEGATTETATKVKVDSLGKKIDVAMRLYYVNALCEKPSRFKAELMETPGWKQFLFPDGTDQAVIEKWIGKPSEWEPEVQVGGDRTEDVLHEEIKGGKRGLLTRRNISAEVDVYSENKLTEAIDEFLGGGENASYIDKIEAETARRIGYRMFRLFLLADQEGYEIYKEKPKGNNQDPFDGLKVVFSNAPQASDFGKLTHPDLYAAKSQRKGRDYMPPTGFLHARKYYSRFMVDFLRHASANTEIQVQKTNGTKEYKVEQRSLMERWWGYKGGLQKGDITYLDEQGVWLGDLPWSKFNEPIHMTQDDAALLALPVGGLHHETFKTLWLSGFMAGGEGRAHMLISETNHNPKNFTDLHWWNKFWKMLDVGIKDSVALEGKFRGVSSEEKKQILLQHKVGIVQNFIYGLEDLPQWEEWKKIPVEIVPNRKGMGSANSPSPQLIDRIIDVANRALKVNGVKLEIKPLEQVLTPDVNPF